MPANEAIRPGATTRQKEAIRPLATARQRTLPLAVLVCATLFAAAPASARAAPDPLTCSRYPQQRQFVESQAWWTRTPGRDGTDFGHLHLGACIPEREVVARRQRLDVRVVLHENPGRVDYVSLVLKGPDYERTVVKNRRLNGFSCPVGTCARWIRFWLRPGQFRNAGLQEVRFRAFVDEPDGNRMHTSINWQLHVRNSKPRSDVTRRPYLRGKGWYTGAGYCEAAAVSMPLPDSPLSAEWRPTFAMVWHGDDGDLPVSHHTVSLDPDLHAGIPGTRLQDGAGPWVGQQAVDLRGLAAGPHKLMLRSECEDPRGSTNAGVLVIGFKVRRT
jgi:hypothetical protein